jgi:hypothetical protein
LLDSALDSYPLFKKEIAQLEATIFNCIALIHGKESNFDKEIEFSGRTIERALFLDDINVLIKAYLRRGLAYERIN